MGPLPKARQSGPIFRGCLSDIIIRRRRIIVVVVVVIITTWNHSNNHNCRETGAAGRRGARARRSSRLRSPGGSFRTGSGQTGSSQKCRNFPWSTVMRKCDKMWRNVTNMTKYNEISGVCVKVWALKQRMDLWPFCFKTKRCPDPVRKPPTAASRRRLRPETAAPGASSSPRSHGGTNGYGPRLRHQIDYEMNPICNIGVLIVLSR